MTDKFKPTFKPVPNIPKTYEQFVLDNQFEQNQKVADSYTAELGAYGDIGTQKGYGPCSYGNKYCTCYVSSGYAPLYMKCPSCSSQDQEPDV